MKTNYKFTYFGLLLSLTLGLVGFVSNQTTSAQTRIDAQTQIKGLPPIVSIARSQCINPPGTNVGGPFDCTGLMLLKFALADGTVKGPYVLLPVTPEAAASAAWQDLPIQAADPKITSVVGPKFP